MRVFRRDGRRLRIFCVVLVLLTGYEAGAEQETYSASPDRIASQNQAGREAYFNYSQHSFVGCFTHDALNWPDRILADANDVFVRADNIIALMLAGGASIVMHNGSADKDLDHHFTEHRVFKNSFIDESLNVLGCPGTHFAFTGLWYALSAESGDDFNRERAWTMMTALAITGITTVGLKAIRDNKTPNDKEWAWPSGHTSSSFTVASVLDEFYGPGVGVPAYILSGLVAFRMMDSGDHWASDVVFGATLGWVVGHTVAGKHKKLELAGFDVVPYAVETDSGGSAGVTLVKRF
jgi:membrane-associated phospholipid phosphatase